MISRFFNTLTLQTWSFMLLVLLSIQSWFILSRNGLNLAYNDSMSHLNISRMVVDNIEPGFAQLGSVWLPLPHILPLLLVWHDWAWQSGFAGSFFSMLSFVISAWGIFWILKIITKNRIGALIGAFAFAFNLNMIYLQATPLTEPIFIMLFVLSTLAFLKWLEKGKAEFLLILGALGFLQVLTRYDGWFVVGVQGLLIILHQLYFKRNLFSEMIGKLLLFAFPIIFGVFIWLGWNAVIFNDPFYFAVGPYSAKSQQQVLETSVGLATKNNFQLSFYSYYLAAVQNVGWLISTLSIGGVIVYLFNKKIKQAFKNRLMLLTVLISPVVFNVLALFLGFSTINLPELNTIQRNPEVQDWFNVRYGILALPLVAVLIGFIASFQKTWAAIAVIFIILQSYITYSNGIVTLLDGTVGASAYRKQDVSEQLKATILSDEIVLLSIAHHNPVAFNLGIPMKNIIHEGVSTVWHKAILEPEKYAHWVVVSNTDNGDPLHKELIKSTPNRLEKHYVLAYRGKEVDIYRLKVDSLTLLNEYEKNN